MSFKQDKYCYPTVGQLERNISQKINSLFYNQFAYRASKVDCHLLDNKLTIFCEEVMTPTEKVLLEAETNHLIYQVRSYIDPLIKTKIEKLVEEIVQIKVSNCIYHTDIDTNSSVGVIMLADSPQVRPKKANRKRDRKNVPQFNPTKDRLSESI